MVTITGLHESWSQNVPLIRDGVHLSLHAAVNRLRQQTTVYPPADKVFYALEMTPFAKVKVVIVGQDPYHGPEQAHGLAFSVPEGIAAPPSLRNIFKEITEDVYPGNPPAFSTDLTRWATQGVLLLNASLSVEADKAGSHANLGWQQLTDQILIELSNRREYLVFLLWGRHAQRKGSLLDVNRHCILQAPHPSPLSAYRGFFGCRHFSRTNQYLSTHGLKPIVW
jgi:uracil-DNA glycosylase